METKKECFVICPIGEENSLQRKWSDQIFRYLIEPIAKKNEYIVFKADMISKPGIITNQIIEKLITSALVIADLTGENPNVFYELAVRHALRKPIIHRDFQVDKYLPDFSKI